MKPTVLSGKSFIDFIGFGVDQVFLCQCNQEPSPCELKKKVLLCYQEPCISELRKKVVLEYQEPCTSELKVPLE